MDKALVTEFTTLKLQQIVQLLATDLTKKKLRFVVQKNTLMLINTTQSFVFSLTLNDMVLYVTPSQTNHNYTHAFEIATFAVDLQKKASAD